MSIRTDALWVITDGLLKLAARFAVTRLRTHCSARECQAQELCPHDWVEENPYPDIGEPRYEWR